MEEEEKNKLVETDDEEITSVEDVNKEKPIFYFPKTAVIVIGVIVLLMIICIIVICCLRGK